MKVKNISKSYGKKKALSDVSLHLKEGIVYGLVGPNGAGKTTLLKLLKGFLIEDEGTIERCGKTIAYFSEKLSFASNLSIKDLSEIMSFETHDFDTKKYKELIRKTAINEDEKYSKLSKGQKMQVRMALLLSRDVDVYLLDEPLNGVDIVTRQKMLTSLIHELNISNKIIVMSTHELHDIDGYLDEIILIDHGKVIGEYDTDQLKNDTELSLHQWYLEKFQ